VLRAARSTAVEQVAEAGRWMIVDGQLRPGHKIAQEAISQKLDVSRIPVREH
jgi:DNA-binding GntR family transcriptional regulator